MEQSFVMTTVLVANALGIILVGILAASNPWRFRDKSREGRCLLSMVILILLGCILDPVAYLVDGKPGIVPRVINYVSNTALYFLNMLIALSWFVFLVEHMRFRLKFAHKAIIGGIISLGVFSMLINFFVPIAFSIDEHNNYVRRLGYFLFLFIDHGLVCDSLILYLVARKRGGLLRLFPVWIYVLPFAVCSLVQSMTYGISVLCASYAISLAGLLASLQGRLIYMDTQTGAYNKNYLDFISGQHSKGRKATIVGIFLNIDGFRKINEIHGRDVGDQVLRMFVKLLNHAVGESGNVVHYSADEFIVLLNAKTAMAVSVCIARIKANIADYNKLRDCPCKISVRVNHRNFDFAHQSVNQSIDELEAYLRSAPEKSEMF